VLQCVAEYCSVLQHVAVPIGTFRIAALSRARTFPGAKASAASCSVTKFEIRPTTKQYDFQIMQSVNAYLPTVYFGIHIYTFRGKRFSRLLFQNNIRD